MGNNWMRLKLWVASKPKNGKKREREKPSNGVPVKVSHFAVQILMMKLNRPLDCVWVGWRLDWQRHKN